MSNDKPTNARDSVEPDRQQLDRGAMNRPPSGDDGSEGNSTENTVVEHNVYVRRGPDPDHEEYEAGSGGWSELVPAQQTPHHATKTGTHEPAASDTRRTKLEHVTARDQLFSDATPNDTIGLNPDRLQPDRDDDDANDSWSSKSAPHSGEAEQDRPTQIKNTGKENLSSPSQSTHKDPRAGDGWGGRLEDDNSSTGSLSRPITDLGENTDSQPAPGDSDAPRLVCIEGPDQGTEFILRGRDIAIGRGPNVDIVMKDPSMSRVHCRILLTDDQIVVTDERSANGTIVNGRKVDRATIVSGATIKLGQSQFRYVEMGDVIKPAETQEHQLAHEPTPLVAGTEVGGGRVGATISPSKQRSKAALRIVAVSVLVAIVVIAVSGYRRQQAQKALRQSEEAAEEFLTRGIDALRTKRLNDACQSLNHAASLMPSDKRFAEHKALCERERLADAALERGEEAFGAHRLKQAWDEVSPIPEDSVYATDRQVLQKNIIAARDDELDKLERKIGTIGRGKNRAWTKAALGELADLDFGPKTPQQERLQQQLEKGGQAPAGKTSDDAGRPTKPAAHQQTAPVASEVVAMFVAGDLDGALNKLGGSKTESDIALRNKLLKFQEAYEAAKGAGAAAFNLPVIRRALAFEQKITSATTSFTKELKKLEAESCYQLGVSAQADKKYPEAYRAFRDATNAVPGYPNAQRKLSELAGQARDLFNQGYIVKDNDPETARQKWKQVLAMVPPDDEIYAKAKKWLDQTNGK